MQQQQKQKQQQQQQQMKTKKKPSKQIRDMFPLIPDDEKFFQNLYTF